MLCFKTWHYTLVLCWNKEVQDNHRRINAFGKSNFNSLYRKLDLNQRIGWFSKDYASARTLVTFHPTKTSVERYYPIKQCWFPVDSKLWRPVLRTLRASDAKIFQLKKHFASKLVLQYILYLKFCTHKTIVNQLVCRQFHTPERINRTYNSLKQ